MKQFGFNSADQGGGSGGRGVGFVCVPLVTQRGCGLLLIPLLYHYHRIHLAFIYGENYFEPVLGWSGFHANEMLPHGRSPTGPGTLLR